MARSGAWLSCLLVLTSCATTSSGPAQGTGGAGSAGQGAPPRQVSGPGPACNAARSRISAIDRRSSSFLGVGEGRPTYDVTQSTVRTPYVLQPPRESGAPGNDERPACRVSPSP